MGSTLFAMLVSSVIVTSGALVFFMGNVARNFQEQNEGIPSQKFEFSTEVGDYNVTIKSTREIEDRVEVEEETEIKVKSWNGVEVEVEYEKKMKNETSEAGLKWKYELEIESEIKEFIDEGSQIGSFDPNDRVVGDFKLQFARINYAQDGRVHTFLMKSLDGSFTAKVTVVGDFASPSTAESIEPESVTVQLVVNHSCSKAKATHFALELKEKEAVGEPGDRLKVEPTTSFLAAQCGTTLSATLAYS